MHHHYMAESINLLRVLISTDNHLGVWEKDEVRKDDSFKSFEEVLRLAVDLKVDFVLLGGDLFHENKPSRGTLVKTVQLLTKYCLGDDPVRFKVLSNQAENFVNQRVNFQDPNLNVGLPIFTIHGNHDDPSGQDNLSAVDILSSCGLVNYFGKVVLSGPSMGRITLSPVLIQKGDTRVALYGLGSIRDERLGRLFQTPGCVRWLLPEASEAADRDMWLNLFVLHQNRVQHTAAGKSCVHEQHLPNFLDLVIWGHEHECRAEPEEVRGHSSDGRHTVVIQPGSSVATALSEGESKRKHCVLLEVMGDKYRTVRYPLESVRPFAFESVVLKEVPVLKPEDSEGLINFLQVKVNGMIDRVARERPPPEGQAPMLPLIRLRVDYTGFSTINSQRFGQRFVGKVACPQDILTWHKTQRRVKAEVGVAGGAADTEAGQDFDLCLRPEALDQACIEDLIAQHLGAELDVLPAEELALALHNFVEKDDKGALTSCVETALAETRHAAVAAAAGAAVREDELAAVVRTGVHSRKAMRETQGVSQLLTIGMGEDAGPSAGRAGAGTMLPPAAQPMLTMAGGGAYGGGLDELMGLPPAPGPTPSTVAQPAPTTAGKGRGRGRGSQTSARQACIAEAFARGTQKPPRAPRGRGRGVLLPAPSDQLHADDEIESHSDSDQAGPGPSSARGSVQRAARAPRAAAAARGVKRRMALDSDEEDAVVAAGLASSGSEHGSDVDMDDVIDDSPPPAARRGQRAGSSGVASAAKHKPVSTRIPAARGAYLAGSTGTGTGTRTPGNTVSLLDSDDEGAAQPAPSTTTGTMLMQTQLGITQGPTATATLPATASGTTAGGGRKRPASFLQQASANAAKPAAPSGARAWGASR